MIAQLRGVLLEKGADHVIVDVGGVGFRVAVSLNTLATLPAVGQTALLQTQLIVRTEAADVLLLVGFATGEEQTAFELLTSVQGIGPKLAMSILSTLESADLARAVRGGDHARLVRIPGIGKKTAERMVLELRDKFAATPVPAPGGKRPVGAPAVSSALVNLGYKPAEADRAAEQAAALHPGAGVAELVKAALRILAE